MNKILRLFKSLMEDPLTKGLNLDDPRTTQYRRRIIEQKPYLRKVYAEWYEIIRDALPKGNRIVIELDHVCSRPPFVRGGRFKVGTTQN